jgi:2,4-didehydro-3-deoxy-L-rhamnonate hydrolase
MKLIRYRSEGKIKTGAIVNEQYVDTAALGEDYNEVFFETGGLERLQNFLSENKDCLTYLPTDVELDCPVARPSKMVCIGLNYADHAAETGAATPPEPVVFLKATTAMVGPNDNIILPKGSQKTDWEVELAVVIGKKTSYVEVAGYCLHNDVSERAFQLERNGTWDKGKGCDTFAPIGPFLATLDEVGDVNNLRLWLSLNGNLMQDGTTANLIFKVPFLIHYLSQFMTLLPGDIISTGTPAGVGLGMKPNVYLKEGDIVELGIDGLGTARQKVVAWKAN